MKKKACLAAVAVLAALGLCGCRAGLNAQIAESIGTTGLYAGGEPVQSPKMAAESELKARVDARNEELKSRLSEAEALAAVYDYQGALDVLDQVDEDYAEDTRVVEARISYQQGLSSMVYYDGEVAQLYFQTLIADPALAFDGDGMSATYNWTNMTVTEFKNILQNLYDNDYVLVDIHEFVGEKTDEEGKVTYYLRTPLLPDGKTPIVLSQDAVVYYDYLEGDGFADRLVLDADGKVKAAYTDAEGKEQIGDYDFIPILDSFVEEHPDFSVRNARGVIGLTGYAGAFGYRIQDESSATYEEDRQTVKEIADALRAEGWVFASNTYAGGSLASLTYDGIVSDTDQWGSVIGSVIGEADILFFPYGDDIFSYTNAFSYLKESGFHIFGGVWNTANYLAVYQTYAHETRRSIDGTTLYYNADSIRQFFDVDRILDTARPGWD